MDERIPFISKLRRLANPIFSIEEFKKAELTLLENLDWNPQYSTLIELLEFYLSKGIINSNDEIELEYETNYASNSVLREKNSQTPYSENKEVTRQDSEPIKSNGSSKENNENVYKVMVMSSLDSKISDIPDFLFTQDMDNEPVQQSIAYRKKSSHIPSDESAFDRNKERKTEKISKDKVEHLLSLLEKDIYKLINLAVKGKHLTFLTNGFMLINRQ